MEQKYLNGCLNFQTKSTWSEITYEKPTESFVPNTECYKGSKNGVDT